MDATEEAQIQAAIKASLSKSNEPTVIDSDLDSEEEDLETFTDSDDENSRDRLKNSPLKKDKNSKSPHKPTFFHNHAVDESKFELNGDDSLDITNDSSVNDMSTSSHNMSTSEAPQGGSKTESNNCDNKSDNVNKPQKHEKYLGSDDGKIVDKLWICHCTCIQIRAIP